MYGIYIINPVKSKLSIISWIQAEMEEKYNNVEKIKYIRKSILIRPHSKTTGMQLDRQETNALTCLWYSKK